MDRRVAATFGRFGQAELRLCHFLNRTSGLAAVGPFFRLVSRLGDGWFWYALMLSLPGLYGRGGLLPAAHMLMTAAVGVVLYRIIKQCAVRERPFVTDADIRCACAPLDQYSFPSGHTLHAVSFTLLATHYFPEWGPILAAFTALVALSRVVLGLHYPTDVAAGALLGGGVAGSSLWLGAWLAY